MVRSGREAQYFLRKEMGYSTHILDGFKEAKRSSRHRKERIDKEVARHPHLSSWPIDLRTPASQ